MVTTVTIPIVKCFAKDKGHGANPHPYSKRCKDAHDYFVSSEAEERDIRNKILSVYWNYVAREAKELFRRKLDSSHKKNLQAQEHTTINIYRDEHSIGFMSGSDF